MNALPRGLLVTGTDTGVGKTFVAAGLVRLLRARGIDCGVMKPAETGHDARIAGPWPADARTLAMAAGTLDPLEVVCPYVFAPPVAPLVAARRAGRPIVIERIVDCFERLGARHDFVLVEGAGGLSVPLGEFGENDHLFDYADLAKLLGIPLLVVARAHLGTLNHSFLTVHYARARGVHTVAIVLNGLDPTIEDASVQDNAIIAEEMTGIPVIGTLPLVLGGVDINTMAEACGRTIDMDRLLARLAASARGDIEDPTPFRDTPGGIR